MGELHMVRLRLDLQRLYALGRKRHLPLNDVDLGYLVHCQLGELVREEPPSLFAVPSLHRPADPRRGADGSAVEVLAYSEVPDAVLLQRANQFANPDDWAALVGREIVSKPMPSSWAAGARLGFEVRACPVVRTRRMRDGSQKAKGHREIDAFLAKCELEKAPSYRLDRREVYLQWLRERFKAFPGLVLERAEVAALRRERLMRRDHASERRSHRMERPDVVFRGVVRVEQGQDLEALLARGIGRHRAFGFGMVLLRPASEG